MDGDIEFYEQKKEEMLKACGDFMEAMQPVFEEIVKVWEKMKAAIQEMFEALRVWFRRFQVVCARVKFQWWLIGHHVPGGLADWLAFHWPERLLPWSLGGFYE